MTGWDLRWDDEPWVKQYTRGTVEWQALPWEARGLAQLIWGMVDRAGILQLGRLEAARALAVALGDASAADRIRPQLDMLAEVEWCSVAQGQLVVPHFLAAQEARQSDAARAKRHRARKRAMGGGAAQPEDHADGDGVPPESHGQDEAGENVTERDAGVTTRSDQIDQRSKEQSRADAGVEAPAAVSRPVTPATGTPTMPPPVDLASPNWWRLRLKPVGDVWDIATEAYMPDATGLTELQLHLEGILQRQPSPVQPAEFIRDFLLAFMRLQAAWEREGYVMGITPRKAIEHSGLVQRIQRGQLDPATVPTPQARPPKGSGPGGPGAGRMPVAGRE